MSPQKFRMKPVEIEAMQWPEDDDVSYPAVCQRAAVHHWVWDNGGRTWVATPRSDPQDVHVMVETLEGRRRISPGDWIIRGTRGEFYVCKPGPFADLYEEVLPGTHQVPSWQAKCTSCGTINEDYYDFSAWHDPEGAIEFVRDNLDWFERTRSEPSPTTDMPNRVIVHTVELLCPDCQHCEVCRAEKAYPSPDGGEHLVCDQHEGHDFG